MDDRLDRAAQRHTRYMRKHGCFSHQCKGERSLERRLRRVHYLTKHLKEWSYGENIAWGSDPERRRRDLHDGLRPAGQVAGIHRVPNL